jgi:hypothetical protein
LIFLCKALSLAGFAKSCQIAFAYARVSLRVLRTYLPRNQSAERTTNDAVLQRLDHGNIIGFSILGVGRFPKGATIGRGAKP